MGRILLVPFNRKSIQTVVQSERGNQQDGFGWHVRILLRITLARKLLDFDFLRGLAPGVWMDFRLKGTRRIVDLLTFMLRSLKAEPCDLGGKIAPALEPFQNKFPPLSLYYTEQSTANSNSFKIAQKTAFEAEGTTIYHR